jgi:membrane-associated phospholipid phosphatase
MRIAAVSLVRVIDEALEFSPAGHGTDRDHATYVSITSGVRISESIALGYFILLAVMACVRRLPGVRRRQILTGGAAASAVIVAVARSAPPAVRDWAPALYILIGYYQSGRFFLAPTPAFEAWLVAWDRRLLGDPATRFSRWPRPLLAYLEIVYMGCFLLVPAGFAALAWTGRAAMADRYWTMVAAAELGSFVSLSVMQSRPPWMIERKAVLPDRAIHRLASRMVEHLTICVNTFPSGHVAGSLAVALAVIGVMPRVGAVFLGLALSIAVASSVGRYHYAIDVVAGAALALFIWIVRQ